jgi:hypothetical protein
MISCGLFSRIALHRVLGPVAQARDLQHLVDLAALHAGHAGQQRQVAAAGEVGEELRRLDNRPDPPDHLGQLAGHFVAEHPHRAGVGTDQAEQRPDRRRLAGSVGPEEPVHLALLDDQVQAVDGHPAPAAAGTESLVQTGDLDCRGHGLPPRPRPRA